MHNLFTYCQQAGLPAAMLDDEQAWIDLDDETGDIWSWVKVDVSDAAAAPGLAFWIGWCRPDIDGRPLDIIDIDADDCALGGGRNGTADDVRDGWHVYIGYRLGDADIDADYLGHWVDTLDADGWRRVIDEALDDVVEYLPVEYADTHNIPHRIRRRTY